MILYEEHRSNKNDYIYCQQDKNLSFGLHLHQSYEYLYVYEGEIECTVGDKSFDVSGGCGILILPNEPHAYTTKVASRSFLVVFSQSFAPDFTALTNGSKLNCPVFSSKEEFAPYLCGTDKFMFKSAVYAVFSRAIAGGLEKSDAGDDSLFRKIVRYAQDNFISSDTSLKKLAKDLGYSYTYISAFFNKNLKENYVSFINNYRTEYAARLLLSEKESKITDVAFASGFATLRSFNRAFRKAYKLTPSEYREKHAL